LAIDKGSDFGHNFFVLKKIFPATCFLKGGDMRHFSRSLTIIFMSVLLTISGSRLFGTIDPEIFAALKARSIGPANMSGRISDIDAVQENHNIIYAGTATGGVWKSENGGITWKPIFDDQPCSSIGAVAIYQKNPHIVWVGTGEAMPRNSCGVGRGVFKSLDGGKTWHHLGLEKTEKISAIRLDPDNPEVAYVAALGTTWGENPQRGVFKTGDGGKTWEKILYVDQKTGGADLAMQPGNPNKLIAAMWEHRRWPWFFKSGGPGSGLYMTVDGGNNWQKLTPKEGLPGGDLGRIGIAFSTNRPKIVYALVEAKRSVLLRSEDGGLSWKTVNKEPGISNRPFYYSRIWVNPRNENIVYMLQSRFKYSEDGGKTFENRTTWGQAHSDYHAMWIHPDGEFMIVGNDGGIVISKDRGKSWRFVQNLPLAQFYHISFDTEIPYNVYGGLQDNGSWRGPAYSLAERGLYDYLWQRVGGGDGFDTEPDPENSLCCYGMSQGGSLFYFDVKTGISRNIVPSESAVKHRYNWNAGFAVDPFEPATIYLGSQFVHRSRDKGYTWEIISPDLTTNDPEKQKQQNSGGLTFDVTNAENHTTILCIAPSPVQRGVIWVGTDDGHVQLTTDGGKQWQLVSGTINRGKKGNHRVPAGTFVPHVEASWFDAATAFVAFDDHRRANWTPYVYVTHDFGKTWQSLMTADIDGFVHVIRQDRLDKELLFLGSEFGLFVSFNGGKGWLKWSHGLPTAPVRDLGIHPGEHDLIIGTHGRSAYIIDDISPLRDISEEIVQKKLHLFKVHDTYHFRRGRLSSYSSPGDTAFSGTNKNFGACFTYMLNPSKKKEKKQEQDAEDDAAEERRQMMRRSGMGTMGPTDKTDVQITILDSSGKKIRSLNGSENRGINRVYWDLRHDAPPSEAGRGGESSFWRRFRGGLTALPGTYTVKIKYEDREMSQTFSLLNDPRLDIDSEVLKENFKLAEAVQSLSSALSKAEKEISDTKKLIKTIGEYATAAKFPKTRPIMKAGRELEKKLTELAEKITPDTSKIQGIVDRSKGLSRQVRTLIYTMGSAYQPVTQAVKIKYERLKTDVTGFLEAFNRFYEKEVAAFRKVVEASGFSLFKPFKPLAIENK
jgi:photosystem II stability/assembly factor-like uncharacterized protein